MKVVYIAGPFRAPTHWGVVANVRRAERWALELWRMGFAVICTHLNSANFEGACPDRTFLDGDLELLSRCDAVFLVPGWQESSGSMVESERAERLGIPCFVTVLGLREWAEAHKAREAEDAAWPCELCPPHEHQGDDCDLCAPHEHAA